MNRIFYYSFLLPAFYDRFNKIYKTWNIFVIQFVSEVGRCMLVLSSILLRLFSSLFVTQSQKLDSNFIKDNFKNTLIPDTGYTNLIKKILFKILILFQKPELVPTKFVLSKNILLGPPSPAWGMFIEKSIVKYCCYTIVQPNFLTKEERLSFIKIKSFFTSSNE